jgi:glycosyltransferase involved in cell wall biosynthesis
MLTLSMILKNEAHTIEKTLASAKPHIDRWCILDTGSTDGTQDVVRKALEGIPGELHETPFVDFSTTRNVAMDLIPKDTPGWVFYLDADDTLEGGERLVEHIRNVDDKPETAFYIEVTVPGGSFSSTRLFRTGSPWRFVGPVHEVLVHPTGIIPSRRVEGVKIVHVDTSPPERAPLRWERDVLLLRHELAKDPNSTRSAFYLALTLMWLGRHDDAIAAFDRRIAMEGWAEEVFYSLLSKARCLATHANGWDQAKSVYLQAYSMSPHRAEPLFDLAWHYHLKDQHGLAVLFSRRAMELELPTDVLFVDSDVYRWKAADVVATHAFYLREMRLGREAARKAAEACPNDERIAKNLSFYPEE